MGVSRLRNLFRQLFQIRLGVSGLQNRFLKSFQIQMAVSILQNLLLTPFRIKMKVPTLQNLYLTLMYHLLTNLPICLIYQPLTDFFTRIHMRAYRILNHFYKIAKLQNTNIIAMSSMFILCSLYLLKI